MTRRIFLALIASTILAGCGDTKERTITGFSPSGKFRQFTLTNTDHVGYLRIFDKKVGPGESATVEWKNGVWTLIDEESLKKK